MESCRRSAHEEKVMKVQIAPAHNFLFYTISFAVLVVAFVIVLSRSAAVSPPSEAPVATAPAAKAAD